MNTKLELAPNPIVINTFEVMMQESLREDIKSKLEEKLNLLRSKPFSPTIEYIDLVKEIMKVDGYFDLMPIPIANMDVDRDTWLNIRKHGPFFDQPNHPMYIPHSIGGSTVGALMGLSTFKSPEMVKAELQGRDILPMKKDLNYEVKEVGHLAEEYLSDFVDNQISIAKNLKTGDFSSEFLEGFSKTFINLVQQMKMDDFAKKYMRIYNAKFDLFEGKEVVKDETLYQHPVFSFLNGNVDRFLYDPVKDTYEVMEIKSTSAINFDTQRLWRDKAVPAHYLKQVQTYMSIMNMDKAYFMAGWGFQSIAMSTIEYDRDLEAEATLIGTTLWFLEEVVKKDHDCDNTSVNPTLYLEDVKRIVGYPQPNTTHFADTQKEEEEVLNLVKLTEEKELLAKQVKLLEQKIKAAEANVLLIAQEAEEVVAEVDGELYYIEVSKTVRNNLNKKEMIKDGIDVDKYTTQSTNRKVKVGNPEKWKLEFSRRKK